MENRGDLQYPVQKIQVSMFFVSFYLKIIKNRECLDCFTCRSYFGHVISLINLSRYMLDVMVDNVHKQPDYVHVVSRMV